jgi:hypothetical protein
MAENVSRQNRYGLAAIGMVIIALGLIAAAPGSSGIPEKVVRNSTIARTHLMEISNALFVYANENRDRLPPDLTMLFPNYISDPTVFWNPGDSDPAPTTIDNNATNAINSTRISFEYTATYPNCDAPLVWDNSAANNGGFYINVAKADGSMSTTPYNPMVVGDSTNTAARNLSNLAIAFFMYANENQGWLPDDPAKLLTMGYVCSPFSFWNPGDSDPEPTAITNSVSNAVNSSHISFDFPNLGRDLDTLPPTAVLAQDNSIANNGGSGILTAYADGHVSSNVLRHLASAIISGGTDTLPEGGNGTYTCTAVYDDGTTRDVSSLARWSLSGPGELYHPGFYVAPASVSYDTPLTLSASFSEFGASALASKTVTVQNVIVLQSLAIVSGPATLPEGGTGSYSCLATYDDGSVRDVTASAAWSVSSGPGCFSAAGAYAAPASVLADTPATLHVSYTDAGVTKTGDKGITVANTVRVLASLAVAGPASVAEGASGSYTCTATYDDAGTQDVTASAMWSVASGPGSFTTPGLFVAPASLLADAPATLRASYSSGGVTKQADKGITVTNTGHVLTGIAISSGPAVVAEGASATYVCTATYDDATTSDVTLLSAWSLTGLGAFTADGVYGAPSVIHSDTPVTLLVSYSENGVTKQANKSITVTNSVHVLASVSISSGPASVPEAHTGVYVCTAVYDDATTKDATAAADWSVSSGPGSFTNPGEYTAPAALLADAAVKLHVSYTEGGVTMQADKSITASNTVRGLTRLSFTSGPATVLEGQTANYDCMATYDDATVKTVTTAAAWSVMTGPGAFSSPGVYVAPASVASNVTVTLKATYTESGATQSTTRIITVSKRPLPDADNDGVPDSLDLCPNTVRGTIVDAHGCLKVLDGDGDGVSDSNDMCPNTPPGRPVDSVGCPVLDQDGDGVPNTTDNCPAMANPDQRDSDGDGVGDACDGCPTDPYKTSAGTCGCGKLDTPYCGQHTFSVRVSTPSADGAPTLYQAGMTAKITAPPAPEGMHFSYWSGDLTGSENPGTLLVNTDKIVVANYEACPTQQTVPCAPGVPVCAVATMLGLGLMKRRHQAR